MNLLLDTHILLWAVSNDPFDRILIAQAKTESLRLLSHDRMLAQYGDPVLAV
jgi:PIN domain nuclease of toxin-antitoxin system